MPPSVPSRTRIEPNPRSQESDYEGGDKDAEETPKPAHRTLSKRRVSDIYDASFASDSGRVPLKSVNINDDAAEKRRRRKSARIVPSEDQAGPSSGPNTDEREDQRGPAHARNKQQLLSVDQAPVATVPLDVMNSNFEEWMKMATDNVRSTRHSKFRCVLHCS